MKIAAVVLALSWLGCMAHGSVRGGAPQGMAIVRQEGNAPPEVIYVEGGRMRLEGWSSGGKRTTTLVDARAKRIWLIEDQSKTFTEISPDDFQRIRVAVDELRAEKAVQDGQAADRAAVAKSLENLPPDQREQASAALEAMRPFPAPGARRRDFKFDRTGERRRIGDVACDVYRVFNFGIPLEEDCISPWDAGVFARSEFETLARFLREWQDATLYPAAESDPLALLDLYPGFPMSRRLNLGNFSGIHVIEQQVKNVERRSLPASTFSVPAGYARKSLTGP